MEEFYSLQGEGFNTGKAAYFLRIGGCDVGCHWCDIRESWNAAVFPPVSVDEVVMRAASCPAGAVVVTGGEPLMYDLGYLCAGLRKAGLQTFLETSGSWPLTGEWDWICLSPKKEAPPLGSICTLANELKIIIEEPEDFQWAEDQSAFVGNECQLFLQPEWSRASSIIPVMVEYIKYHPRWRISLQSHKYMRIP